MCINPAREDAMFNWHARDAIATEWLDASAIDDADLRRNLRDIRRINALLGWSAFTIQTVASIVRSQPHHRWTLLDVASGSADIPLSIARWSRRTGIDLHIIASDIQPQIVEIAREQCATLPHLTVTTLDAMALPHTPGSIDIVLCTLALHHFTPDEAIILFQSMARVGRHILVFDVVRSPLAYAGVVALTHLGGMHKMTCHDGPVSVRRAYSADEVRELAHAAGLENAHVSVHFPFRLMLRASRLHGEAQYAV
jgi:2-polyprenyl-3-methyl-5-hydroxy-6-metoxy-1,4-benzoquinol methylase